MSRVSSTVCVGVWVFRVNETIELVCFEDQKIYGFNSEKIYMYRHLMKVILYSPR